MATVAAITAFVGVIRRDQTGPAPKNKMGDVSGLPVVTKQGESVNVFQGQLFDSSHPVVKAFPKMFGQPDNATRTVEQATAAPGEKRNLQAAS